MAWLQANAPSELVALRGSHGLGWLATFEIPDSTPMTDAAELARASVAR